MGAMNKQMNLPALSNIMREFDRQNEKMEMTSEMMGDAVDDAFEVCRLCCASLCPPWAWITFSRHSSSCPLHENVGVLAAKHAGHSYLECSSSGTLG